MERWRRLSCLAGLVLVCALVSSARAEGDGVPEALRVECLEPHYWGVLWILENEGLEAFDPVSGERIRAHRLPPVRQPPSVLDHPRVDVARVPRDLPVERVIELGRAVGLEVGAGATRVEWSAGHHERAQRLAISIARDTLTRTDFETFLSSIQKVLQVTVVERDFASKTAELETRVGWLSLDAALQDLRNTPTPAAADLPKAAFLVRPRGRPIRRALHLLSLDGMRVEDAQTGRRLHPIGPAHVRVPGHDLTSLATLIRRFESAGFELVELRGFGRSFDMELAYDVAADEDPAAAAKRFAERMFRVIRSASSSGLLDRSRPLQTNVIPPETHGSAQRGFALLDLRLDLGDAAMRSVSSRDRERGTARARIRLAAADVGLRILRVLDDGDDDGIDLEAGSGHDVLYVSLERSGSGHGRSVAAMIVELARRKIQTTDVDLRVRLEPDGSVKTLVWLTAEYVYPLWPPVDK